ncbi:peroxide stress protein YaaA [Rhodococcus hoagii]|nr:peroxide stress protein YaaA [Prescottella equi]
MLPPSETKSDGGKGAPLDLGELSMPQLTETREMLVSALVDLAADTEASNLALGLGPKQADEIERNARCGSPHPSSARALHRCAVRCPRRQVVHESAAEKAFRRLAMGSALFGAVRAGDPIPAYRLSGGSKLPARHAAVAVEAGVDGRAALGGRRRSGVDLRSGTYQQLGRCPTR